MRSEPYWKCYLIYATNPLKTIQGGRDFYRIESDKDLEIIFGGKKKRKTRIVTRLSALSTRTNMRIIAKEEFFD